MLNSEMWNPRFAVPFLMENGAVLARGFKRRLYDGKPFAFSFNVSEGCPIGCECYQKRSLQDIAIARGIITKEQLLAPGRAVLNQIAKQVDMSDEGVVQFFEQKRAEGYIHVNLIGGEPYVRPALLERIAGIIPFAWLVTSGTTPLRRLKHTTQVISVDGATAETHDGVRKSKGLFDRIMKNAKRAREEGVGPIFLNTVLNRLNYREIGGILECWYANGLAQGVLISTMTPIKGSGDDGMRLPRDERVWIVEELHRLKAIYGDFMMMTEAMIDRLHPNHTALNTPQNCSTAQFIESYASDGSRIKQCILSERADCSECGCVITLMAENVSKDSKHEFGEMFKYFLRLSTIAS